MSRFLEIAVDVFWLAVIGVGGGWVLIRSLKASDDPVKIVFKWLFTIPLVIGEFFFARHLIGSIQPGDISTNAAPTFMMVISIAVCGVALGAIWGSHISNIIAMPLTNLFDGGHEEPEKKPYYSSVLARRNQGRPLEAIMLIREQLAKFPADFEGVMLLASLQAENMNDLPGAEITLNHFCDSPKTPDRQVVAALTQLADWHMKIAADVDAARAALQKIVARFPDTEIALRAEQRLAHLGETEKIILAQHDRQSLGLPEGVQNIGLLDSTEFLKPPEINPGKLAAAHVKHLEAHPHDTEVREKLAAIYAKDFQRLDLATMELAQLINEPKHTPKQVAHWLNLLANFQIELGADVATVQATLEKIVENFPDLPVADLAQRRLARLNNEFKGRQKSADVKLGVYEQNVGLKYGSPRKL